MTSGPEGRTAERVYSRLAPVYDLLYGAMLQPGRNRAMARLAPQAGDLILEVGVGTGFGLAGYPADVRIVAVDLSSQMLARASKRLSCRGIDHITLCRMDAAHLAFAESTFDAVYAPYLINVVPDSVAVAKEMVRVCRPGGRIVLLNHFDRDLVTDNSVSRAIGRIATRITSVNWFLDLETFLQNAELTPVSVEDVNIPRVSSVVLCRKP